MTSTSIAAEQAAKVRSIVPAWSDEIVAVGDAGIRESIRRFEQRRDEAAGSSAFDARAELIRCLAEEIDASWAVDPSSNRLTAARKGIPGDIGKDEMAFLEEEDRLIKILAAARTAVGTDGFDGVVAELQGFHKQQAERYGMDYGLRRTVAVMLPLVELQLGLMSGRTKVPDVLDRYAAEDYEPGMPGPG